MGLLRDLGRTSETHLRAILDHIGALLVFLSPQTVPYDPSFESMLGVEKMEVFDFLSIRVTIIF